MSEICFFFFFWVRFNEIRFEIEIELLRICKQAHSLTALPLFLFLFFFCMNTCVRGCDHEVALVQQFLRCEDQQYYQMDVSSMDLTYFIWANPFEKASCAHQSKKKKTTKKNMSLIHGGPQRESILNLSWSAAAAYADTLLSSIKKSNKKKVPQNTCKPHICHIFHLIVMA